MIQCELCRIHNRKRYADYIIRIDGYDWAVCYDCKEEERTKGNDKIVKTLRNVYWNDAIKKIAEME